MTAAQCQSYRDGQFACRDGFMQKPFCRGYYGCHSCGHIKASSIPYCLSDELPMHWLKDDGSPAFSHPSDTAGNEA